MTHSLYVAAGHVLRQLVSAEGHVLLNSSMDAMRDVLLVAAHACSHLADVEYDRDQARDEADELRALLEHVEKVLNSEPLPINGGSWAVFELAEQVRLALRPERRGRP